MSTIEEMQKIAVYLEEKIPLGPTDLGTTLSRYHLMQVIGIYRDVAKNRSTLDMPPWNFKDYHGIHNDDFVIVGNHTPEGMKSMLEDYFGMSSISRYAAQLDKRLRKFYFEGKIRTVEEVDGIILDLGLSSDQLENSGRGFSFMRDEPLIMTLKENPRPEEVTAFDIINNWSEQSLADILYGYGEEKFSRRI